MNPLRLPALLLALGLLAGAIPVLPGAHATSHGLDVRDDAGDVRLDLFGGPLGNVGPSVPANAFADNVDIVRAFVENENETHLTLGVQVQRFDETARQASGLLFGMQVEVAFTLSHDPAKSWRVFHGDFRFLFFGGAPPTWYTMCWETERDSECDSSAGLTVDRETSTVRFLLDRTALAAHNESGERGIRPGDRLENLVASTFALGLGDRAPDEGGAGPFVFQAPSANDRLALLWGNELASPDDDFGFRFGPPVPNAYGVTPGAPATFPLHVVNRADTKKVVNLAVRMDAPDPAAWNVTAAPTLVVPAQDSVVVNVIVNPTAEVRHRDLARLAVRAQPVGEADVVGVATASLMATVTPNKTNNVLHLHLDEYEECIGGPFAAVNGPCRDLFPFGWQLMNTLDEDALYEDTPIALLGLDGGRVRTWFEMDTPLGQDLRFDLAQGVVTVDLTFTARVSTPLGVQAHLLTDSTYIGGGHATGVVGNVPTAIRVEFAPALSGNTVNATDGRLQLFLEIEDQRAGVSVPNVVISGVELLLPNVHLLPADSTVTLPLLGLPPRTLKVSTGEHLVSLALRGGKDPEEYVNPGRGLLFNLSVVNEGVVPDVVRLRVNATQLPGWTVALLPAARYRLDPGESANVTVVVRAPEGAKEGERMNVEVLAVSDGDASVEATMRFAAIVTEGIDIPDERLGPLFVPSAKKKDSPGPDAALGLAVLGLLGAALGRRRRSA